MHICLNCGRIATKALPKNSSYWYCDNCYNPALYQPKVFKREVLAKLAASKEGKEVEKKSFSLFVRNKKLLMRRRLQLDIATLFATERGLTVEKDPFEMMYFIIKRVISNSEVF